MFSLLKRNDGLTDYQLISLAKRRAIVIWLSTICVLIAGTVIVGGATRLTNSGLSITEWKPILGAIPPLNEKEWLHAFELYKQIPEYRIEHSHLDLSGFKFIYFWEYLHRNLGRLIGIVFLVPFLFFVFQGGLPRALKTKLTIGFLLGAAQGLLGWLMVSSGLSERVDVSHYRLTAHLLLAFFIFSYFLRLILDLCFGAFARLDQSFRNLSLGAAALHSILGVQIIWGALVAGLRAGHSYNTFPKMNGEWLPTQALYLKPLWLNFFENPAMVQFIHRWVGAILILGTIFLFWLCQRSTLDLTRKRVVQSLLALTLAQFTLGILTLISGMSLPIALLHQLGGLALFGHLQVTTYVLRREFRSNKIAN